MMKIFVIGAGIAGMEAALTSASIGAKTIIFDEQIGGNFLNKTCIPTKIFLELSKKEKKYSRLIRRAKAKISFLKSEYERKLTRNGIEIINSKCLVKRNELKINNRKISLGNAKLILCTGSKPLKLAIKGSEYLKYSDELISLEEIPSRVAIIGGGPEGLELAEIFNNLGSEVTIIEKKDRILFLEDVDISKIVLENLIYKKIKVLLNTEAKSIKKNEKEYVILSNNNLLRADLIFSCIGWKPCTDYIFLESFNVDEFLKFDKNVFGAGDLVGAGIANVAKLQGRIAVYNATGQNIKFEKKAYPYVINVEHKVASFGLKESRSKNIKVFKSKLDRGIKGIIEDSMGYLKIIYDTNGNILGASCISMKADEIINFLYALAERGVKIQELKSFFPSSPSYIEDVLDLV